MTMIKGAKYLDAQEAIEKGITVQTLRDGTKVKYVSVTNHNVTINHTRTIPMSEFHHLGGIVALHYQNATKGGPFFRFS